ncbi:hypothetical protein PAERUG_P54_1_London_24_VIM_2_04_13_05024 [Pseudomonas aeruginosa]|nr:hypothetical protein PAERUG_E5_London_17_VIM_2_12_12_05103 [Pseudomonas aeruginosa]SST09934.1 Uncharacterised protein [Acinetobacter baumannii]CRR72942.1 hypothetical protein PAERUG_E16_London_17_VIM_2_04_14_06552 [Pseudomonas aeruginosa]CRS15576.1 hypothetical protein PAERUG_P48_London_17_VIM_2_01_13_04869 [Pseudomonas aeruginosa]CRW81977.1 hypothetical protein PAERUG_P64_East_of_England_6_01_14_00749 [Pseudomonas aeruginosa]
MFLHSPDQPVDCARPWTTMQAAKIGRVAKVPITSAASAEVSKPPSTTTRVPKRSANTPHMNWPTA